MVVVVVVVPVVVVVAVRFVWCPRQPSVVWLPAASVARTTRWRVVSWSTPAAVNGEVHGSYGP